VFFFCVALLSLNFLKHLTEIPDCRVIVNVFISFLFSFFAGFIWVLRCSYDHAQLNFYLRAVLFGICLILRVPAPSSSLTCFLFSFFFLFFLFCVLLTQFFWQYFFFYFWPWVFLGLNFIWFLPWSFLFDLLFIAGLICGLLLWTRNYSNWLAIGLFCTFDKCAKAFWIFVF